MTVKQLIAALKSEDLDREIILSSDSEGNSFSRLHDANFVRVGFKMDDGEIVTGLEALTPVLKRQGYSKEDVLEGGKPALIIYP